MGLRLNKSGLSCNDVALVILLVGAEPRESRRADGGAAERALRARRDAADAVPVSWTIGSQEGRIRPSSIQAVRRECG